VFSDAAGQVWPPFVLVAGLLLVGAVVERDGLFAYAGALLARLARNGLVLYAGGVALVAVVTATLNLDTSVAFLTPVLVHTARSRGEDEAPLLYSCLLLSNASSLLLPGSNLTNLIVLGHEHVTGHELLRRTAAPFAVAVIVTALVVAIRYRQDLSVSAANIAVAARPTLRVGLPALVATLVLVLVLANPALPVLAVGLAATGAEILRRRLVASAVVRMVGVPTLAVLFAVATALGVLGREWDGPSRLLSNVGVWWTAVIAAGASVVVNNLPAAALLSARPPDHPVALLIGLNVGPNLFVTGSLSWLLWLRAARTVGAQPSIREASRVGLIAAPLAIAAAVAVIG
jgi:arsenical pump membrane protein